MARPREEKRDAAFNLWADSGGSAKLKDIATQLGVPDSRIRKWKTVDKWEEKIKERSHSNKGALQNSKGSAPKQNAPKQSGKIGNKNAVGHGAPKGNKNAVGNKGGSGGPPGNKKAVVTGAYETIWMDCLSGEERTLCSQINTDKLAQVEEEIQLITIRERRMMKRIQDVMEGLSEKQRKVFQERLMTKEPVMVKDPFSDKSQTVLVSTPKMVVTSIEETERRQIDDILRIEEALTRIQDKKSRLLALKHTLEVAAKEGANSGAEDHAKRVQEAWDNR